MRAYSACRSLPPPLLSRSVRYHNGKRTFETCRQRRHFHPSRPHYLIDWAIDPSISGATFLIREVHSATGLPWVASLPLTAFGVRAIIAATLQRFAIEHSNRQLGVIPLVAAWRKYYEKNLRKPTPGQRPLPPAIATSRLNFQLNVMRKKLYRRGKVMEWGPYVSFLQFPVFLAIMEGLRRMTGMDRGLLGVLQVWWTDAPSKTVVPTETSMATEGALWFPDLLAPDPYWVLPFALSTILYANVTTGFKVPSLTEMAEMPRTQLFRSRVLRALKYGLQFVSIYMAPSIIYADVPSGLVLYWISSAVFANLSMKVVRKLVHSPVYFKPCKEKGVGSIRDR